jgi:hypothetical protein
MSSFLHFTGCPLTNFIRGGLPHSLDGKYNPGMRGTHYIQTERIVFGIEKNLPFHQ